MVISPDDDQQIAGHLDILAAAGWEVHAVASHAGAHFPRLDRGITVHRADTVLGTRPRGVTRAARWLAKRADHAAFRVLAGSSHVSRERMGWDMDVLARWRAESSPSGPPPGARHGPDDTVDGLPADVGSIAVLNAPGIHDRADLRSMVPWLAALIDAVEPDIVHSGPLTQAAALTFLARARCAKPFPTWMVSSWGHDLGWDARDPLFEPALRHTLAAADWYLAECARDADLARDAGFTGRIAGMLPIDGGIDVPAMQRLAQGGPTSDRRVVMVDGRQSVIGRGLVALEALRRCADLLHDHEIVVHGADASVRLAAELLQVDTGIRTITRLAAAHGSRGVMADHGRARASISLRLGDGSGTWAREAMTMGSLPIGSNTTPCMHEWVAEGAGALMVHPEQPDEVADAIRRALLDDALVDRAAAANRAVALRRFDRQDVAPRLVAAYEHAASAGSP